MNSGTFHGGAQAFKLDTLLKLLDVRRTDGKTTLSHFVVRKIIRSEGVRAERIARESGAKSDVLPEDSDVLEEHYCNIGLQVVSGLGSDVEDAKKTAALNVDSLTGTASKLGHELIKSQDFLKRDMKNIEEEEGKKGFHQKLSRFLPNAEVEIMWVLEEEKRIMSLVKCTADYFHGNAGKNEGLRLFIVVRDFLIILQKACKEVKDDFKKPNKNLKKEGSTVTPCQTDPDSRQQLFPPLTNKHVDVSS